jgi:hypothetical protein
MRRAFAILVLGASVLGFAACSNGGGSSFVPNPSRSINSDASRE